MYVGVKRLQAAAQMSSRYMPIVRVAAARGPGLSNVFSINL